MCTLPVHTLEPLGTHWYQIRDREIRQLSVSLWWMGMSDKTNAQQLMEGIPLRVVV